MISPILRLPATVRPSLLLLSVAFAGLAPVAVYAGNGTVVLLFLGALGLVGTTGALPALWRGLTRPVVLTLAALFAWSLVACLWSPDPGQGALTVLRLAVLASGGVAFLATVAAMKQDEGAFLGRLLIVTMIAMLAMFLLELATDAALATYLKQLPTTVINAVGRGTAVLVPLVWPVALLLARRAGRLPAAALIIFVAAVTVLLPMMAAAAALLSGLAVFVMVRRWGRRALYGLTAAFAVFLLALPVALDRVGTFESVRALDLPLSWQHRTLIWEYTANRIMERPLIGHGFDAARHIGADDPRRLYNADRDPVEHMFVNRMPLHPHNGALQIWLELGLPGVLLGLALVGAAAATIGRVADSTSRAMCAATLFSLLTIACLSFGIWQYWWQATAWFAAAATVLAMRGAAGAEHPS